MSRSAIGILLTIFCFVALAPAQEGEDPVFGNKSDKKPVPRKDAAKPVPQAQEAKLTPDEKLVEQLVSWPGQEALVVARQLVTKGPRVVPLLMSNLDNNDWRIRCGCAYALGEMKEQSAFPKLQKAVRDIANRISLGPFFEAMAKIDPISATSEILPFVAGTDVRGAKAAMAALPEVLDQKYEGRVIALTTSPDNAVRFRGLTLLPRLRRPVAPEIYIRLLGDRTPRVARSAADILGDSQDASVYKSLLDLALSGSLRSSSYALLALVRAEDLTNRVLLDDQDAVKKRLMLLLNIRGDLENTAAAIALANMSMHTRDKELRRFADTALMDFLLGPTADGRIFKDYIAVKDLTFKKAAMISGENFGENGRLWVDWWIKNREGFRARRELSSVSVDDADRLRLRYARRDEKRSLHMEFVAGRPVADDVLVRRPIYVPLVEMKRLVAKLNELGILTDRGMKFDPGWAGDYIEVALTLDSSIFHRVHYGSEPEALVSLGDDLELVAAREKWQLFWDRSREPDFARWFAAAQKRFNGMTGEERARALADEALAAYRHLDPRARRAAREAFRGAGNEWLVAAKERMLEQLVPGEMRLDAADELLGTLAMIGGQDVLAAVTAYLPLFRPDGVAALESYISQRPLDEVLAFDDGNRPDVRVAIIPYLAARMDADSRVMNKLIGFMSDVDPRVREALVLALRKVPHERILSVLASRIAEADDQAKQSLVELYGAIGEEEAVETLMGLYEGGTQPLRVSVIKALQQAQGERGIGALITIARDDAVAFYRIEAMTSLNAIGSDLVRARVRQFLADDLEPARLRELMPVCASIFRASLDTDFVPFLAHEDVAIRKEAALLLGPLGIKAAVPELLKLLIDETESNRAWEYLELISCHEVITAGSEEALAAYRVWFDQHQDEKQHEWFMAAMKAEGLPSQHMLGFLEGKKRPFRAIALLIRALDSELWFVRVNASNYLTRIRGASLAAIDRRSTPAELARAKNRWSEWYKALVEGI